MSKFEFLKSNTILFPIELNKNRLSDFLIDDILNSNEGFNQDSILRKRIENKEDLKMLKTFLKKNRKTLGDDLYFYCLEELNEIKSDIKWSNTQEGKLIMGIDKWLLCNRRDFLNKFEDYKIFLGRSLTNPKELIIGGRISENEVITEIKKNINSRKPPVTPFFYLNLF